MSLRDRIVNSAVWKSVFRHGWPRDHFHRVAVVMNNVFLHVHPVAIEKKHLHPRYTWCMGGIAFFLFLVEILTGVLLMFYYRPTLRWAYLDMVAINEVVSFGLLREIHRWAGHAMVIAVWLHMYRVFLTGSYKPPRQMNWVVGVVLLAATMLLAFTGYLLPWDQLSVWAVTVGTSMTQAAPVVGCEGPLSNLLTADGQPLVTATSDLRYAILGGGTVDEAALNRFYVWHCVAIPVAAGVLMGVHFWRVRKDGKLARKL